MKTLPIQMGLQFYTYLVSQHLIASIVWHNMHMIPVFVFVVWMAHISFSTVFRIHNALRCLEASYFYTTYNKEEKKEAYM